MHAFQPATVSVRVSEQFADGIKACVKREHHRCERVAVNIKRKIEIKNIVEFFEIQEKVYFRRHNNLEYVKYSLNNKDEYVNYEKEDTR